MESSIRSGRLGEDSLDFTLKYHPPLALAVRCIGARSFIRGKYTHLMDATTRTFHSLHVVVVDRVNQNPNRHFCGLMELEGRDGGGTFFCEGSQVSPWNALGGFR